MQTQRETKLARPSDVSQAIWTEAPARVNVFAYIAGAVALATLGLLLACALLVFAIRYFFGDEGTRIFFVVAGVMALYLLMAWQNRMTHRQSMQALANLAEVFNRREMVDDDGEVRRMEAQARAKLIDGVSVINKGASDLGGRMLTESMRYLAAQQSGKPATMPWDMGQLSIDADDEELE